jgi:hypothetical protein
MTKRFLEGLALGAGFALAFLAVLATGLLVVPITFSSRPTVVEGPSASFSPPPLPSQLSPNFDDLPIEEQIKASSVIALARFEAAPDGKQKAIIREFLKKAPGTEIHYEVGGEYPRASHYPTEGRSHGDGVIIFFVGSPAEMRMSMSYHGDRITGLGDIPIELFRKKCETNA